MPAKRGGEEGGNDYSEGELWKDGIMGRVTNYKNQNMEQFAKNLNFANKTFT